MRASLSALLVISGCAGDVVAEHEANVRTGPGVEHVRFAALDGCCDLVTGAPTRGQVDVARPRAGGWEVVGSFFAAADPIRDVVPASVGGRPSMFVRTSDRVMLLSADLLEPHRLRDPVRVHEGGARAIAAGDLDRDGIDEVVVASGSALVQIDETEWALFEDPSEWPRVAASAIDEAFPAAGVAIAELTRDGTPDVIAIHREQAIARIYDSPGVDHADLGTRNVELPSNAVSILATTCQRAPVVALLEDGSVVGIDRDAEGGTGVHAWATFGSARAIFSGGDSVVVVYEGAASMTLHNACGSAAGTMDLSSDGVTSVAITPRHEEGRRVAIAREDAEAVSVFAVSSSF